VFVLLAAVMISTLAVIGSGAPPQRGAPAPPRVALPTTVAQGKIDASSLAPMKLRESPTEAVKDEPRVEEAAHEPEARDDPEAMRIATIGRGYELFLREWMPDDPRSHGGDGLGPVYNDSSCAACHNLGGVGGGGPNGKNVDIISTRIRRRSQTADAKRSDDSATAAAEKIHPGFLSAPSVVLHRFGTAPDYVVWRLARLAMTSESSISPNLLDGPPAVLAKAEIERSRVSPGFSRAGVSRSQRNPTALFGAGVIDSISDEVIEESARVGFRGFPDTKGRVSRLDGGQIGRFGWKAQIPTLREFVLTACAVEVGLEVPDHPQGGDPLVPNIKAPGLDLSAAECDDLIAYVRSLPAPGQQVDSALPGAGDLRAGKELFLAIGCGACHAPDLGDVKGIYSDLLLHDMGSDGSDTGSYRVFRPEPVSPGLIPPGPVADDHRHRSRPASSGATDREWRTPPLWGLRDSGPYLHDGRAETLDQAIALHGGQGTEPATRYFGLSPRRRQQVQSFLKSLIAPAASRSS
jgi:CxxC motif-containing protein (DUF1111 family)